MDADTADYIAARLREDVMLEIADELRTIPAGELRQAEVEFEAMSADLSEPLGRSPMNHATLEMLRALRAGYDPRGIAEAFGTWAVLPNRAEVRIDEFFSELPRLAEGGHGGQE